MTATLRYFTAVDVHAALDYGSLVEALREEFAAGATAPVRTSHAVTPEGDRLLLMPAWDGSGLGVKIVTVFPRNRQRGFASVAALYLLMDGTTGHPIALIDGEALTLRRTSATSALASSYLSRADARHLVVVGTGALAPYMAAAHCATRPIERISVWGRSHPAAKRTAATLASQGLPAEPVADLAKALADADIVSCATTAREPIVRGALVRNGMHVDLVGAFTPEMRESDDDLVARAGLFVDTFAGALKEAGDLVQPMQQGVIARDRIVAELADLVTGRHPGRRARDEVTLFKSVGTALEDLCAAKLVASQRGVSASRPG
jgi:ornithine cyclodeaminase/alanine dehydrogenase-like protein (mu-crystallin family)